MHTRNSLRLAFVFGENKFNISEFEILCVLGLLAAGCCYVHSKFTQMAVVKITAHLLFTMLMSTKVNTLIYSKLEHNIAHNSFFISRKCGKNTEIWARGDISNGREEKFDCMQILSRWILFTWLCSLFAEFMHLCDANGCFCHLYNIKLHNSITQKQGK